MTIVATKGDRLDQLVYKTFGSLEQFENVLLLNSKLVDKVFLEEGDVVILPDINQTEEIVEDELW